MLRKQRSSLSDCVLHTLGLNLECFRGLDGLCDEVLRGKFRISFYQATLQYQTRRVCMSFCDLDAIHASDKGKC